MLLPHDGGIKFDKLWSRGGAPGPCQGLHDRYAFHSGTRCAPRRRQTRCSSATRLVRMVPGASTPLATRANSDYASSRTSWGILINRQFDGSTPEEADIDSVIDVRAVFQQGHREVKVEELPPILLPRKGRFGLVDYEKAYTPELADPAVDAHSISREPSLHAECTSCSMLAGKTVTTLRRELVPQYKRSSADRSRRWLPA